MHSNVSMGGVFSFLLVWEQIFFTIPCKQVVQLCTASLRNHASHPGKGGKAIGWPKRHNQAAQKMQPGERDTTTATRCLARETTCGYSVQRQTYLESLPPAMVLDRGIPADKRYLFKKILPKNRKICSRHISCNN